MLYDCVFWSSLIMCYSIYFDKTIRIWREIQSRDDPTIDVGNRYRVYVEAITN